MTTSHTLYFAYGSNLNHEQMAKRCPLAKPVEKALLREHVFIINTRGYANVMPMEGHTVFGLLWKLTPECVENLDICEGVSSGLYTKEYLMVEGEQSGTVTALVYISPDCAFGIPGMRDGRDYWNVVQVGAREAQIPDSNFAYYLNWRDQQT